MKLNIPQVYLIDISNKNFGCQCPLKLKEQQYEAVRKIVVDNRPQKRVSVKAGTPPGTPGTPGTRPGTPGTRLGTPGTPPGTPGTPPGTPGTPPGTRWNTSYEATHVFLYKFTCFALNSGVLDGYDLYFHLYFCFFK